MQTTHYDVIVIGAGPGGYVAAIRCAQLGLTTACIEKRSSKAKTPTPGGTCLNVGCIPSKSLLESSHCFSHAKNGLADHGITVNMVNMNISKMMERKNKIIETLSKGILSLFTKHNIDFIQGHGKIKSQQDKHYQIEISPCPDDKDSPSMITATYIIIATGSIPATISSVAIDKKNIVSSTEALEFEQAPRKLGIIGAGVIGIELGSVWNRLGSEVIILETSESFLPSADRQIAKAALKTLTNQGLNIKLGQQITGTGCNHQEVIINYENATGKQQTNVDKLIIAAGRTPNTENLTTEEYQLTLDDQGFIEVNQQCQTNLNNVYAIGDVIRGPMLAHKASKEGRSVADYIFKQSTDKTIPAIPFINQMVPWVIYTWPEIAWVGLSEQALKHNKTDYTVGTFPLIANSRAKTMAEHDGLVKILADRHSDTIIGVHIFAANASELIAEATLAMAFDASSQDLAETIHAHPSLAEALHEAALDVHDQAIHI